MSVAVFLLYLRNRHMISSALEDTAIALQTIALPMSRQDIADFLGLKKETVSRSFTHLDKEGFINRTTSHEIEVTDLAGLRELAGIHDFASPLRVAVSQS